ncbi:hypothetical protein P256_00215 [Acinetobacter nectaris CIP 110549]|uniref:Uncharacterized protein n=1 Tax=Acinetobacter nectaris CIP 110549 TaxID=1392540 RepID=V2TT58_9GAMM|nr:HTH domain-containing protein [Acinetobacter nectaris]ESK41226.1 hypothetical protein P256_00215 [Acinetobacter nectaris CIP 110549]
MTKYMITVEGTIPPKIMLGDTIGGAIITEMKKLDQELVSAAYLAQRFSMSVDTIRRKLEVISQGSSGKALYNLAAAQKILTEKPKSRRGPKRGN